MIAALAQRARPREGWTTYVLWLLAVLSLPAAAIAADWVPGDDGLLLVAVFAAVTGRLLASRADWGWAVWLPVGMGLGLLAALGLASRALLIWPGAASGALTFVLRWLDWVQAAASGGQSQDPDVFLLYAALLCWAVVLFSSWALFRHGSPLLALAAPLLLGAVSVFYSTEGIAWVVVGILLGVLLLAIGGLRLAELAWDRQGVDFAADLMGTVVGVAFFVSLLTALVSYAGPLATAERVSDWFRRTFREPTENVEDTAERLFGGVRPAEGGVARSADASSFLPQNRLLGGRPDLRDVVIMVVSTDEPSPPPPLPGRAGLHGIEDQPPPHYWQGLAFDVYSGVGWGASIQSREPVTGAIGVTAAPMYREVVQHFQLVAPHGDTLYSMAHPFSVTQPVEALWRISPPLAPLPGAASSLSGTLAAGDLAGLASEVVSYTVVSRLPDPWAPDLRAAPALYSEQFISAYLQLPDSLPKRVIDLAIEVTQDGESAYDKARLLEGYLRQYPYNLEIDPPPAERDVADYFLFESREGFCDYYATAFVVMARAAGVPARLVTGYVGGNYDYDLDVYVVHQYDGHSWPEVYFEGWGWIGFEPTGSQPVQPLPEERPVAGVSLPTPLGPPARVVRARWRLIGIGAPASALLIAALVVWLRRRPKLPARELTLARVWANVGQAGARFGLPQRPGMTVGEYANALARALETQAAHTSIKRQHWTELAGEAGWTVRALATLYCSQTYGRQAPGILAEDDLRTTWSDLRAILMRFVWLRRLSRLSRSPEPRATQSLL